MCKDRGLTLKSLNVHGHLQLTNKTNFDNTVEDHQSYFQSVSFLLCSWQFRVIFWLLSSYGCLTGRALQQWWVTAMRFSIHACLSCLAKHLTRVVRGGHQFLKWPFKISSVQQRASLYPSCCMFFRKKPHLNNFSKQRSQNNTPFYVCTPSIAALTPG